MFYSVLKTSVAKKKYIKWDKRMFLCLESLSDKLWRGLTPRRDTVRTENMHRVVTRAEKWELMIKNVGFFYCQSAVCWNFSQSGSWTCQLQWNRGRAALQLERSATGMSLLCPRGRHCNLTVSSHILCADTHLYSNNKSG